MIRKALETEIPAVAAIYDKLHTEEEAGRVTIGWIRGVYPTEDTARMALRRDDLFVQEDDGHIVGAAIINMTQVDAYSEGQWTVAAEDTEVMVLHTLVIDPDAAGQGFGKRFVAFYEDYARKNGCKVLRMDTNCRNARARAMYQALGYREAGIVPCVFNGIQGVKLVLLEKSLKNCKISVYSPGLP